MADAKIVVCGDEASAKTVAAMLKKPSGGGYKTVDGPFKTDGVAIETVNLKPSMSTTIADDADDEIWFVIAHNF